MMRSRRTALVLVVLLATAACGGGGGGGAPATHPVDWVHTVTNQNRVANATFLENPLTFGRPDLILLVTQNRSPGGVTATSDRSPVGVLYDAAEGASAPLGRWMIADLDLALEPTMPAGAAFNVSILQPGPDVFVHRVTSRAGATNHVSHLPAAGSALAGSRDASVFLTARLTHTDGTAAATNRHGVGTYFTGGNWAVFNLNDATMPTQCAYNVVIVPHPGPDGLAFNTVTAQSTVWSGTSVLGENAVVHVAQGRDTRGTNDRDVALRYSASRAEWGVVNTEGSDVRAFATFRVLIRRP